MCSTSDGRPQLTPSMLLERLIIAWKPLLIANWFRVKKLLGLVESPGVSLNCTTSTFLKFKAAPPSMLSASLSLSHSHIMEGLIPFLYKAIVSYAKGQASPRNILSVDSPSASYVLLSSGSDTLSSPETQFFSTSTVSNSSSAVARPPPTAPPLPLPGNNVHRSERLAAIHRL